MEFIIKKEQLERALKEIEQAEKNGFYYCEPVFKLVSAGYILTDCKAVYSDIIEKAHPTNSKLNWGRFQEVTKSYEFVDGELKKIKTDKNE